VACDALSVPFVGFSPFFCCSAQKPLAPIPVLAQKYVHAALQHAILQMQLLLPQQTYLRLENTMALTPEQITAAHKANLETLFGLTTKAFEGIEKIVELNVAASRAALTEAANHSQALLSVKDAQALLALQSSFFQPLAEKTAAYNRHLFNIATSTSTEVGKAFEAKTSEFQQGFNSFVESTAKNAPAGSETAVAVMKTAVSAASNAFESVQKAVKQASDMAEANLKAVVASSTSAPTATARSKA
jgi:phasin family protein